MSLCGSTTPEDVLQRVFRIHYDIKTIDNDTGQIRDGVFCEQTWLNYTAILWVPLRNPDEMETQPMFDIPLLDEAAMQLVSY